MISPDKAQQLLPPHYTDKEIEEARDYTYQIAEMIFEQWLLECPKIRNKGSPDIW